MARRGFYNVLDANNPQKSTNSTNSKRQSRLNNLYNTPEHKNTRLSIRKSIIKNKITQKDKYNINRKMTNERVAKCRIPCLVNENGGIGSCVITNTTISLKDCTTPDNSTLYHYIKPIELAVDTLQYVFNNKLASIITDSRDGTPKYLAIQNFPTLQIETDNTFKDTRRDSFYKAYEDATTLAMLDYKTQLQEYLATGIYRTAVKYATDNYDNDDIFQDGFTTQDINYVKKIAAALIYDSRSNTVQVGNVPEELKGMEDYIIVDAIKLEDGGEYIICGYPDASKMRTYISLRENLDIGSKLAEIYKSQKANFAHLFAEMHNSTLADSANASSNASASTNKINLELLDTEIHKFMKSINITYFESWVRANTQLDASNPAAWVNSTDYINKIQLLRDNGLEAQAAYIESEIARTCLSKEERAQQLANIPVVYAAFAKYVNELLLEYLNKPMFRIRYHFIIFRWDAETGMLVPAIFNIKQLEPRHKPLLERVQDLIQMQIPRKYGILEGSRHGLDRYKLFHSYTKYGDFFIITTEYLHTMSNFTHYAYIYENSMELEEIIYSLSSARAGFWQSLRIEYQLKKFRIASDGSGASANIASELSGGARAAGRSNRNMNWRTSNKTTRKSKQNTNEIRLAGTIMMIYEKSYQEYTIIYKDARDGVFKVLEVKSNLAACKNDVINEVAKSRSGTGVRDVNYGGRLFKVVRHSKFDSKIMRIIKRNNPLIIKLMKSPIVDKYIKKRDYIKTELLDNNILEDVSIINVNHFKPIIYFNFMMNMNYIKALLEYNKTLKQDIQENKPEEKDKSVVEYGNYYSVNCVINPDNCGYDIIISSRTLAKTVLWIIPHIDKKGIPNNKYLRNFTYLDNSHIPLLNAIKRLFLKEGLICFVNIQATYIYGLLHLHIATFDEYRREYPVEEQGSRITREINIDDIIIKLNLYGKYYLDFNVPNLNVII